MWAVTRQLCKGALLPPFLRAFRVPGPWERTALAARVLQLPGVPWGRDCTSASPAGLSGAQPWEAPEAGTGEQQSQTTGQFLPRFNIDALVALLRQENAKDICVIRVPFEMKYTDYFVIVSASSTRHLHAIAQYVLKVYKHLKAQKDPQVQIEGKDTDDWMCIDFGNIVVHFMLPETREIYELEKLWTLRSYDDQLAEMAPETLPEDFIFGLNTEQKSLEDGVQNNVDNESPLK